MIDYSYPIPNQATPITVRLDGRMVGIIKQVEGGFQYVPKGQKEGGDVFGSIGAVKRSIEAEE